MTDRTGSLPTLEDVERAQGAIRAAAVKDIMQITQVSPELAVELPNVLRCLELAEAVLRRAQEGA